MVIRGKPLIFGHTQPEALADENCAVNAVVIDGTVECIPSQPYFR